MTTPNRKTLVGIMLAAFVLLAVYTWAFHEVYAVRAPGANDFFSRWAGARLYLTEGLNPYGEETSLWIQNTIWGHPALPDEDPSLFAYPFYTVFVVAPYALISPYSWAQAAWQVTLQVIVVATFVLMLRYHQWKPKPLMLGAAILWMLFFYPTARSIILGQLGLLVFLLTIIVFYWLYRIKEPSATLDIAAGILLALTTIKPQMQFLIIPFLILWALRDRRWLFMGSSAISMVILLGISFLLLPTWFGEWLAQVSLYPAYTPPAVLYILTHETIPLGGAATIIEYLLDAALLLYLLYEWWRVLWKREDIRLDWVLGLTLVITHLIAPRTATTHFTVFVFPLIVVFRDLSRRRSLRWLVPVLMLILVVGMWALFIFTLEGNQEANIVHVPLPLLMLAMVLFIRPKELQDEVAL